MAKMRIKKKSNIRKAKTKSILSTPKTSHWKSLFTAVLKILVFPLYVTYIFWRTLLVDKPREAAYVVKDSVTSLYGKSKSGYRKARKLKSRGKRKEPVLVLDDLSLSEGEGENVLQEPEVEHPGLIRRKIRFVQRSFSWLWRLFIKTLHVKRIIQKNLKWTIRTSYTLWTETGKLVEIIKNKPSQWMNKVKLFINDAIEGDDEKPDDEDQSEDHDLTQDQSDLPEPISLEISQDQSSFKHWPNDDGYPTRAQYSRKPISRGRPQTRQSFSQRIEGTVPARKFFAPPTNEELIDDYFNTYDAIQPHDPYRRLVYSRSRRHRLISETDAESIDVNPRSAKEKDIDEDEESDEGGYDDVYERKNNDDDY